MQALRVVEIKIGIQALPQGRPAGVVLEINILILYASPQALDENMIKDSTASIHANPDTGGVQPPGKIQARELRALVAVENIGPSDRQGPLKRRQTEARIETVRELPTEHEAAMEWKRSALPSFKDRSLRSPPHTGRTPFSISSVPTRPLLPWVERTAVHFQMTFFTSCSRGILLGLIRHGSGQERLRSERHGVMDVFHGLLFTAFTETIRSFQRGQSRG